MILEAVEVHPGGARMQQDDAEGLIILIFPRFLRVKKNIVFRA